MNLGAGQSRVRTAVVGVGETLYWRRWEVSTLQVLSIYKALRGHRSVASLVAGGESCAQKPTLGWWMCARFRWWEQPCPHSYTGSSHGRTRRCAPTPGPQLTRIKEHPDPGWANQIRFPGVELGLRVTREKRESDSWFLHVCVCRDLST